MKNLAAKSFTALAALALAAAPCHALTVICNYVPVGSTIPGIGTSRAINPALCHPDGGASIDLLMFKHTVLAGAIYWTGIYTFSTSDTLTIDYGLCDASNLPTGAVAGSGPSGFVTSGPGTGNINRCSLGISVSHNFYLDPDTYTWNEYGTGAVTSTNVAYPGHPGQFVEDERFTTSGGAGDASFSDLFDIVMHEIGHELGMSSGSTKYNNETLDGDIDVTAGRPIPGISWLSNDHRGHLTYTGQPHSLMYPNDQTGQRKWPSQADISCIAQIEGWWVGAWDWAPGGGGPQGLAANNPPH